MILLIIAIILLLVLVACAAMARGEIHTETTTYISERPEFTTVGSLTRIRSSNGQYYVIDPVDKTKNYLNSKDDMYEDADGNIWKLRG